jgi:hypothetical protein
MKTLQPLDTLPATCLITWHHIPENSNLQQHHCGNLDSHMLEFTHVNKSKTGIEDSVTLKKSTTIHAACFNTSGKSTHWQEGTVTFMTSLVIR